MTIESYGVSVLVEMIHHLVNLVTRLTVKHLFVHLESGSPTARLVEKLLIFRVGFVLVGRVGDRVSPWTLEELWRLARRLLGRKGHRSDGVEFAQIGPVAFVLKVCRPHASSLKVSILPVIVDVVLARTARPGRLVNQDGLAVVALV